jgi:hypothetical protein
MILCSVFLELLFYLSVYLLYVIKINISPDFNNVIFIKINISPDFDDEIGSSSKI